MKVLQNEKKYINSLTNRNKNYEKVSIYFNNIRGINI
jgi:hypothetical protein